MNNIYATFFRTDITFAQQWIFALLVVVLFVFIFSFIYNKYSKRKSAVIVPFFDDIIAIQKRLSLFKNKKIFVYAQWVSLVLAVVFLSVALARPQHISPQEKVVKNGVDILIALDVSESMLAEDLQPNRIEAAKKYISDFVSKLKTDRVGLEVFAGKTFTQSPMSFDYNVIKYYLAEISTDSINQRMYGLNGTAIGDAILSAVNRFKNASERTKVLILLTDGEANVGADPVFAAEHARTNGIKIYTIGLGKKEGALMPIGIKNGRKVYARNQDGTLYKTKFDEKTLQDVAQVSGGEYFWAGDNTSLEKSLETIGKLEKKEYQAETSIKKTDLFYPWLVIGYVFMLFAVLSFFIAQTTLRIQTLIQVFTSRK